jgi:hypothetical protein
MLLQLASASDPKYAAARYGLRAERIGQAQNPGPSRCPDADHVRTAYGIFSAMVMLIFFLRLLDLAVLNNTLSAYIITAGCVRQQVFIFLIAVGLVTCVFACGVTALMEQDAHFEGIPRASLSYLVVSVHMLDWSVYEGVKVAGLGWMFTLLSIFIWCIDVFLLNLLIAQICSEHHAVHDDMVGYARMRRISCIYCTLPYVREDRWDRWLSSLGLGNRLEFNQGDVGLSGGIQITEAANLNPTLIDAITRFGGSTSKASPWPALDDEVTMRVDEADVGPSQLTPGACGIRDDVWTPTQAGWSGGCPCSPAASTGDRKPKPEHALGRGGCGAVAAYSRRLWDT